MRVRVDGIKHHPTFDTAIVIVECKGYDKFARHVSHRDESLKSLGMARIANWYKYGKNEYMTRVVLMQPREFQNE